MAKCQQSDFGYFDVCWCLCGQYRWWYQGFQIFDFRKYFTRLKYAPAKNNSQIDPRLLRRFILELIKAIDQENDGERTQDFFVDYYLQNFDVKDQSKFEREVSKKWVSILNSIDVIERSEKVFQFQGQ